MEDAQFWKLAAKYVAGEASEQEIDRLRACVESDPVRRDLLAEAEQAWEYEGKHDTLHVDAQAAWNRLERRIAVERKGLQPSSGSVHGNRFDRPARRSRHAARRRLRLTAGAAGIVLAAILAVLLWPGPEPEIISTATGERRAVELADGSRVLLNAESRLTLIDPFGSDTREVHLEGEAFFEVAPDEQRPFLIHTHAGVIQVVGTAFGVDAYADEGHVRVAVAEGAVALRLRNALETAEEDTVVLRPRQLGVLADQRLVELHRGVDLAPYLAWREGRLVFEDAPFPVVVRRLERWYGLHIDASSLDQVDRLNAVFDQESASDVIHDIALALGLDYEHAGDRVRFFREQLPSTMP